MVSHINIIINQYWFIFILVTLVHELQLILSYRIYRTCEAHGWHECVMTNTISTESDLYYKYLFFNLTLLQSIAP